MNKLTLAAAAVLLTPMTLLAEAVVDGNTVTFKLDVNDWNDKPNDVNVAGSFNGWNGGATDLTDPDGDGVWTASIELPDGTHHYKFVIDGNRWITDDTDDRELRIPDNYGGQNSGVLVGPDIRKAPPVEDGKINAEYVQFDPVTDAVLVDKGVVRLRIRVLAGDVDQVVIGYDTGFSDPGPALAEMESKGVVDGYEIWEGEIETAMDVVPVVFGLTSGDVTLGINRGGTAADVIAAYRDDDDPFEIAMPDLDVPGWTHHAVWYQVFPERFRNGNPDNDPGRFADYERLVPWSSDWWDVLPGETEPNDAVDNFYNGTGDVWQRRYGGDLQGLQEKLPYLKSLGVNAIYLNPIFEAESMHKYDTADFRHVDDNFGVVTDYEQYPPGIDGETDDPATWQWSESDKVFLAFLQEAKAQEMRVIIDGVFNHTGRAHPFFQDVLEKGRESKYADWFDITDWGTGGEPGQPGGIQWNAWDQPNGALPTFKKDAELGLAPGPREHIFNITKRWLDPDGDPATNDGIDGWRLDVPGDIPHPFWIDWRKIVKDTNPDAYITGEIWSPAQAWLKGDQFDAVMNYQFAMPTQDFFVDEATALKPSEYAAKLTEVVEMYPRPIAYAQQNLMGSHDTDRLASMFVNPDRNYDTFNRPQDNALEYDGPMYSERAPDEEEWARFKQLVLWQHSFVGAPMTYYGDEAGMWSPDDPSNRQPFPWKDLGPYEGKDVGFNDEIFAHYQKAIAIRNALPALRTGDFSFPLIDDEDDVLMMKRSTDEQTVYIVINRSGEDREVTLDLEPGVYANYANGAVVERVGERPTITAAASIETDGELTGNLPAWGTAILVKQ